MKWMRERDLLIAQTMAFVQSVSGQKPDAAVPQPVAAQSVAPAAMTLQTSSLNSSTPAPMDAAAPVTNIEAVLGERLEAAAVALPATENPVGARAPKATPVAAAAPVYQPIEMVPPYRRGEFQSEITNRIAHFRANQQRFIREREEYGTTTMARVLASLVDPRLPPRSGK